MLVHTFPIRIKKNIIELFGVLRSVSVFKRSDVSLHHHHHHHHHQIHQPIPTPNIGFSKVSQTSELL